MEMSLLSINKPKRLLLLNDKSEYTKFHSYSVFSIYIKPNMCSTLFVFRVAMYPLPSAHHQQCHVWIFEMVRCACGSGTQRSTSWTSRSFLANDTHTHTRPHNTNATSLRQWRDTMPPITGNSFFAGVWCDDNNTWGANFQASYAFPIQLRNLHENFMMSHTLLSFSFSFWFRIFIHRFHIVLNGSHYKHPVATMERVLVSWTISWRIACATDFRYFLSIAQCTIFC